ncbi:MAG TPA: TatD family deoxyribonuclease [bacterium]|nr:TatD family deoxyribonuclease [bacterium]
MQIDTHAHLNFAAFDKDREKVIKRCLENNVWMINVGSNFRTSKKAVEIAENIKEGVFATIGLHPMSLDTGLIKLRSDNLEGEHYEKEFDYERYKSLAGSEKVIAIGEIGLDYYWKPKTKRKKELFKQKQKDLLLKQLKLAKELDLPVVFHCRMANHDLFRILSENPNLKPKKAVAHSFVGTVDDIKKHLDFGYFIGFNGIIFKNIEGIDFKKVIEITPLNKILIETDCPYLVPPKAQTKRNEPIFVKYVAQEIAKIKNTTFEQVTEATTKNAQELFGI